MKTSIETRYEKEEKKNRKISLVSTIGSICLILAVLLSLGLYYEVPPPEEMGVSLILGTPDGGMMQEFADLPAIEESSPSNPSPDESLTQDIEDAPEIQQDPGKPDPVSSNTPENTEPSPKPARTFNTEGRTGGSGDKGNPGNEGDPKGGDDGSPIGTGGGKTGAGLGSRKATYKPTDKANCTQKGEIKVKITVDAKGKVTHASFVAAGSTTTNTTCVREAVELAKKWEFDPATAGTESVNTIITIILQ